MSRCSGVGNYIANLVAGLRKLEKPQTELELLYFSNRCDYTGTGASLSGLMPGTVYERDHLPVRMAWMQLGLPRSLKRTQPDLCHFPNYLTPVIRDLDMPFLATMYDMSVYRCPEYHPLKTTLVHQAIIPIVARRAHLLVTVSESAKQDILHYLKVPEERVRVVYGGVSSAFLKLSPAENEQELRQRYNLPFPYILMVGTLEPRKNHTRLVQAYRQLIEQERLPHHLVLVGAHGWKEGPLATEIARSGLSERIHFLGYVPTADLPSLYRNAAAFVFPSLHEGFGLPVLEALACGTPTLISNDPALLEVSGPEMAVVINPYSVEDIAAGLYRLLTDAPLTETLRMRGPLHARQYSWEQSATQTLKLYQEVQAEKRIIAFTVPVVGRLADSAADSGTPPLTYQREKQRHDRGWQTKTSEPSVVTSVENLGEDQVSPLPLERAIFETVLYADIFSFALNPSEIHRFLIGQNASLEEVKRYLSESGYLKRRLEQHYAYFYLRGRHEALEQRKLSDLEIEKRWQVVRRWGKLLRAIPYLRAALVTGSLAAGVARPHDDIDFLLITEPERLWTCRALIIGLVYLARLSGVELCPNYLLVATDNALTLPERNLYTAREFSHSVLIFGRESYSHLSALNMAWVCAELPNASTYLQNQPSLLEEDNPGRVGRKLKQLGEKLLNGRLGEKLERWEQSRKIARFSSQKGAEARFSPEVCKGHFGNYNQGTLAIFAEKCRQYGLVDQTARVQEV
jgi:glycosyltransferase involved in cell wall biosynthesis